MKLTLEMMGKVCPIPLVEAKSAIEKVGPGGEVVVNFDCTQATDAIPRWAAESGLEITNFEQIEDAAWTITIKK